MIKINQFEQVTQIMMGHEFEGQVLVWVAAYLVDGLLIDTGCKHTEEELAEFLEGQNLKLAVNTHYHEDHIGANHILKERLGIQILAHRESIPLINQVPTLYPHQENVWGYPEPTEVGCLQEKIETAHFHFDVVETPGHCKGHVVLVEPQQGWCFSGDIFASAKPRVLREEENTAETVRSMKRLVDLETDRLVLFTAQGNIVQDGREALQFCSEYLQDLSQRAKQLEKKGLSITEIRDELFGKEHAWATLSSGQFSTENLIRDVLRAKM